MSDTTAASILHEQNLIFSNDSLTVQERIHQLYMLLLRYDSGHETSVPETPKPMEGSSNQIGGVVASSNEKYMDEARGTEKSSADTIKPTRSPTEVRDSAAPYPNQEVPKDEQEVTNSLTEPTGAQTTPKEQESIVTKESPSAAKAPINTDKFPGSVVHDDGKVLHGGQDEREENNVPMVSTSHSEVNKEGTNTTEVITSGLGGSEADQYLGIKDTNTRPTELNPGSQDSAAAIQDSVKDADRKSYFLSLRNLLGPVHGGIRH